ncbi:MAG: 50S ribosomal protein L13 [Candidatus Sungbacteria bacterium]|uniref:50S ribosomal protein L13 n=1 Tax=Candidatus Sungiibacteriota bacterium TaxID=2750080 RepID=A0A932R0U7_9BACT|nr:50S ribosomal protein L13 [Candidatus Sungbacteria bacterium]
MNADGRILGRLASEAALLLRGKTSPDFAPHRLPGQRVVITHTDGMRFTGRAKPLQKLYRRHSGRLGNLKEESLGHLMTRDSRMVLRHAVSGMLPKNRLRKRLMRNLILFKGPVR